MNEIKFDTKVQFVKYRVLREVAKYTYEGTLMENIHNIPKTISPGPKPTMRCCIYKERAIASERVYLAMGGNKEEDNVIEVINIACDECPLGGYEITNDCRGCLSHRCRLACHKQAISFDENLKAHIDKTKCVNCGLCAKACPYNAIANRKRPCAVACKVNAIGTNEDMSAKIDHSKCISCGACVYQCPFGAISDKSSIVDIINALKSSDDKHHVYAIVAPAISSQFDYAKTGQVVTGLKKLGFYSVVETALGADMVAYSEAQELAEKKFMTSSCCPAFVQYVKNNFPKLAEKISHNPSPMVALGKYIKSTDPDSKVVFIGPCTAKKKEAKMEHAKDAIDYVMTFEELQAVFDAKEITLKELEETLLDNASYFGRIFARIGGLSEAVKESLSEQNIDFEVKPSICEGIDNIKMALMKANRGDVDFNFIEGMACLGGCIGGPCNITHEVKDKIDVDKYGKQAKEQKILDALKVIK